MKRILTLAVTIFTAALLIGVTPAHATKRPLHHACRFQLSDNREGWTPLEVKRTIRCAVRRWPVPGGLSRAFYIANRESRFHQYAYNPSGCAGVYQWARGTWANVLPSFPPLYRVLGHSVFNARSNVMYAIKHAHTRGWGPWGF